MKILFVDMHAGIAGHTRTATTLAQALQRRGHEVSFAVAKDSRTDVIEAAQLPIHRVPMRWAGRYPDLEKLIGSLYERGEVDVVHSFNSRGLPEAAKAAKALGVPVFQTICGGRARHDVLETKPIISLSHEVKKTLLKRMPLRDEDIHVIPARLDFAAMLRAAKSKDTEATHRRFREKYALPPTSKVVLRIARVNQKYKGSLLQGADAVARLREEGFDVRFVHIGFATPENAADLEEVRAHFDELNRAAGEVVAVSAQDEAPHAPDYSELADIVIGLGRTAFEGMLFEKPVLLVGSRGFAGLVGRDDTEQLAFYNFSGRNLSSAKPYEQSVTELTATLRELLRDEALRARVGEFGRRYVLENLDANAAARRYEVLYTSFSSANYPSDAQLAKFLNLTPRRVLRTLLPEPLHRYYRRLRHAR